MSTAEKTGDRGVAYVHLAIAIGLPFAAWIGFVYLEPHLPAGLVRVVGWVFVVGAGLGSLTSLMTFFAELAGAIAAEQHEVDEAKRQRGPLRESIRRWSRQLDAESGWLLTATLEEQRAWAVRRFREIITDWPREHRELERLAQSEDFEVAIQETGQLGARFQQIWAARIILYQFARLEIRASDRVDGGLEEQEKIARSKAERAASFEEFRRTRLAPLISSSEADDVSEEERS